MPNIYTSKNTKNAPLLIDAVYKGDPSIPGYEPISTLLSCANMGGFRAVKAGGKHYKYIVLYSRLDSTDWPDSIDIYNGTVIYYGDNKNSGSELHSTPRAGNRILRDIFESLHLGTRESIPPIFLFTKGDEGRDVIFRGLLVPGAAGLNNGEDLVAVWKISEGKRFQNYRAIFTVLKEPAISHEWIDDLRDDVLLSQFAPSKWINWRNSLNPPEALTATKTTEHRKKSEQIPQTTNDIQLLDTLYSAYKDDPYEFEKCAAEITKLMDRNIHEYNLTRRTRDGGRDATGVYKIGLADNAIDVEFALEAKCYSITNSIGVRETSRLISRLKHRQFGIIVTTSYLNDQATKELLEDGHPVIIVTGKDIVTILKNSGLDTSDKIKKWVDDLAKFV